MRTNMLNWGSSLSTIMVAVLMVMAASSAILWAKRQEVKSHGHKYPDENSMLPNNVGNHSNMNDDGILGWVNSTSTSRSRSRSRSHRNNTNNTDIDPQMALASLTTTTGNNSSPVRKLRCSIYASVCYPNGLSQDQLNTILNFRARFIEQNYIGYHAQIYETENIGTHNSFNSHFDGYPYENHHASLATQLDVGYRTISFDLHTHYCDGKTVLLLCHATTTKIFGSTVRTCSCDDDRLSDGLNTLKLFLDRNPREFIMLSLQDELGSDSRRNQAANIMVDKLGPYLYQVKDVTHTKECKFPMADPKVSKGSLVAQGYKIVAFLPVEQFTDSSQNCKDTSSYQNSAWRQTVHEMKFVAKKGYKEVSEAGGYRHIHGRFNRETSYVAYEDRSIFGSYSISGNYDSEFNEETLKDTLERGVHQIGLDFAVVINRFEGIMWSWAPGQPASSAGNCAFSRKGDRRWKVASCTELKYAACRRSDDRWVIFREKMVFAQAFYYCQLMNADFDVPTNANYNYQLRKGGPDIDTWVRYWRPSPSSPFEFPDESSLGFDLENYVGCFRDSSDRALPFLGVKSPSMTIKLCRYFCATHNFTYSGLQNEDQCWCGNYGHDKHGSTDTCNKPCSGNSGEICGGSWTNAVYYSKSFGYKGCWADNGPSRVLPFLKAASATLTIDSCRRICHADGFLYAGLQLQVLCWCGNDYDRDGPSAGCTMPCRDDPYSRCGGLHANSVYQAAPRPIASFNPNYIGCYADNSQHTMTFIESWNSMNIDYCRVKCRGRGDPYTGLQNGNECFCGGIEYNTLGTSIWCDKACAGGGQRACGGESANSVYHSDAFGYQGCWLDNPLSRVLPALKGNSNSMTIDRCKFICHMDGFLYAGLQFSTQCWCGNVYDSQGQSTGCTLPCVGEPFTTCGGFYANSVYLAEPH